MDAHDRLVGDYKTRSINRERLDLVREIGTSPILDIGCGGGEYIEALSPTHDIVGVDILEYDNRSRIVRGDATRLPFQDDAFSTVLLFEVLEHLEDIDACLQEIRRVASNHLLLSVPNAIDPDIFESAGLAMHPFVDPTHVNFFDENSLEETLTEAGFSVEQIRRINPVYPGILCLYALGVPAIAARKIGRRLQKLPWARTFYTTLLVHATI